MTEAQTTSRQGPVAVDPPVAASESGPKALEPSWDAATPEGAREFVRSLCQKARDGDFDWVEEHVALPLRGSDVIEHAVEKEGELFLAGRDSEKPADIAQLPLCEKNQLDENSFRTADRELPAEQHSFFVTIGGDDYSLVLKKGEDGVPVLLELSAVLREIAVPWNPKKKVKKYDVTGWTLEGTEGFGGLIDVFVQQTLKRQPSCVRRHRATSTVSASLRVRATKVEGQPAHARVYAGTIAPMSLIECLESQLDKEIAEIFKGVPFDVYYLLMISIPVSAKEAGAPGAAFVGTDTFVDLSSNGDGDQSEK